MVAEEARRLEGNRFSGAVIGAAIEVHKHLGPGLLESAYEECLAKEMTLRGIAFERQKPVPLVYKGLSLDCGYRLDFSVGGLVIVELKAVDEISPIYEAQVLSYMRFTNHPIGLLINFRVPILHKGIKRFIL